MVPRVPFYLDNNLRPPPPQQALSSLSKISNRSHSSSLADDERSSSGDSQSMGPDSLPTNRHDPPEYDGEDVRLTSRKELHGWYAYGFAAEVFVICGIGRYSRSDHKSSHGVHGLPAPD